MALQRQAISINLSAGLDTKTDSKHVVPGKLTTLENGVYRKGMAIEKRKGHDKIKNLSTIDSDLGTGSSLEVFNDELLQFNSQKLYSYAEGANRWVDKGSGLTAIVDSKQVIKNTATQTSCDSAILNNVGVYAWEDSRGGVRASIVDETTGIPLVADESINSNGTHPKVFAFEQYLYVFYVNTNSVAGYRVNTLSPFAFTDFFTVSNSIDATNPNYEVIEFGGQILFLYNSGSDSESIWFDADFDSQTSPYDPKTYAGRPFTDCVTAVPGRNNDIYVFYHDGTNIKAMVLDQYGNIDSEDTISGAFATIENITAINSSSTISATSNLYFVYFTVAGATPDVSLIYNFTYSPGNAGTPAAWLRSVGLYTKAFAYLDETNNIRTICIGVAHESDLQSTYFLVTSDKLVIAKQQYTNGGGLRTRPLLGTVSETTDIFTYAILKKNRIVSENATIFTPTGVMRTTIDFTNADRFTAKQLGNNMLICGGVLNMYDGQSIVEHGFHLYPERVVAAAQGSGGSLADGSYLVYVVYEWTDNFGQIHRSRPSVPVSVTCSAGGTDSILVTAPTLRLTRKENPDRSRISIVGYVTDTNGSIAYRFTSITTPILNSTTVDTTSLGLITSVSTSNEILYTTGDVLANDPAPPCSVIEVFQNRVWLGGLEESSAVAFSKENKVGTPVEFSEEFTKAIESSGGKVKALSFIDDKFIILKADQAYVTYGDGPNDTDTLGGFSELERFAIDVGSENPRSITRLPNGIILKTKKGFYAIDTSLTPQYIGADVEAFNDLEVTSANLIPDLNECRFTTRTGNMLTYNYYYGKWNTSTNLTANSSVIWKNNQVILKTDGIIFKQNTSVFKDADAAYGMKLTTGWISLGPLNSYKRVYELLIMGEYKSNHKIRIKVAYDNDDSWIHEGVYDPTTEFPVEFYGDDSPYGESGTIYGGKPIDYAIRVRLKRQKCSSFKFELQELVTAATTGTQESMTISDVGILVGLKKGVVKKPQSRNMKVS